MTKHELKYLMGQEYPSNHEDEESLLFRVNLFPQALGLYKSYSGHLYNIYRRSNGWFLYEQLIPDAIRWAPNGVDPLRRINDFISHYIKTDGNVQFGSKNVNWKSVYAFIDGLDSSSKLVSTVNKYRSQLLVNDYDMV